PSSVSPDTFPAKLWWLVNNPQILSITWDDRGQGLLIDEHLFISEVLETDLSFAPGLEVSWAAGSSELFKTRSFPSFIRQLNLYGFHKLSKGLMPGRRPGPCHGAGDSNGVKHGCFLHHFHSPYFLRDRPELLVHLKRLTKANKAKLLGTKDLPSQKPNQ
ncbi:HSF5 protein, partial [Galbula dea]|nr:HSF5 protein [Galbula dea]